MTHLMRVIPPIHELINDDEIIKSKKQLDLSNEQIKNALHKTTHEVRHLILNNEIELSDRDHAKNYIIKKFQHNINAYYTNQLSPVINATGTILHTNLGRARLSETALQHMVQVGRHYSTLEYDLKTGGRGSRHSIVEEYLKDLTGAEAAMVVNNNAASVYMVLSAFTKGKEVIVSRGELVEIGGSFRVSSIMEESGAILREVGTTNKTRLSDYELAFNDRTQMIMKVHTSNFHMVGFTESVSTKELSELAHKNGIICYEDLGSGMLYDLTQHGIGNEPLVKQVIDNGVDLVSFSGDKLLGGPQVGIIAGKKEFIDQLKKHQLARVLRVDKLNYAALEETLKLILRNEINALEIPTVRDILKSKDTLINTVNQFIERSRHSFERITLRKVDVESKVGGGTLPEVTLPSCGIALAIPSLNANQISESLRNMEVPVIVRIEHNQVIMDFRTLSFEEEELLLTQLLNLDQYL